MLYEEKDVINIARAYGAVKFWQQYLDCLKPTSEDKRDEVEWRMTFAKRIISENLAVLKESASGRVLESLELGGMEALCR